MTVPAGPYNLYNNILNNKIKQTNIGIEIYDKQILTWENVLQLICEKEDDKGPPEIMFPGCYSDKKFGL